MLTVGIIGFGAHGRFLFDACQRIGGVRVRSICRRSAKEVESLAAGLGVIPATSHEEVLADPGIDAVFITSPSESHREHCLAALRAGKHVLVEKPLADTLEDAAAIEAAAMRSDRLLMVDHCERFNPAFVDAHNIVQAGRIGTLRAVNATRLSPLHLNNPAWQMGVLDTAVHNIDLICWLMGDAPTHVSARAARVNERLDIPDNVWISLEFPDGRHAEDHIAWVPMDNYLMPVAHPRFLLQGTSGFYQVDLWRRSGLLYAGDYSRYTDDVLLGAGDEYLSTMAYSVWRFARAIERGEPSPMPASAALLATRVALAARDSIRDAGRRIRLETAPGSGE